MLTLRILIGTVLVLGMLFGLLVLEGYAIPVEHPNPSPSPTTTR